jgi:hypothetical protein
MELVSEFYPTTSICNRLLRKNDCKIAMKSQLPVIMEQNQNNQNQQAHDANQQQYNREFALQAHIMHQGQSINRLYGMLGSSSFVRGFKTVVSVLMEIFMYMLLLGAVLLIIFIPSDPMIFSQQLNDDTSFTGGIHSDTVTGLIITLKVIIFLFSLSFLLCAILLRRNRKKSSLIGHAHKEAETLKRNFDQAMQLFRF